MQQLSMQQRCYKTGLGLPLIEQRMPLCQVRDLYWTARNFRNRVSDFLRYRRVTANMDERFPEATEEELARCDNVCIICREEMLPSTRNKKLTCGHVFHLHCLRCFTFSDDVQHFTST